MPPPIRIGYNDHYGDRLEHVTNTFWPNYQSFFATFGRKWGTAGSLLNFGLFSIQVAQKFPM
jgi:hypothetical protein